MAREAFQARRVAAEFDPKLLNLFDEYVHGWIDRQHFLARASAFGTTHLAPNELLEALNPNFHETERVSPNDPRLMAEFVQIESPDGNGRVSGYLVRPVSRVRELPAVLVVHENRGLNPHYQDIARRIALQGFIAFAPDALFIRGGYPGHEDSARELFQSLDGDKIAEDFAASAQFLKHCPGTNGKVGVVGFSYGGNIAHHLATRLPNLDAAVAFYGAAPKPQQASNSRAELLVHLAEQDERVNANWPAYEAALASSGARYTVLRYPGTQHGFHNDTTARYEDAAAKLAWQRTIAFFNRTLRTLSAVVPAQRSA